MAYNVLVTDDSQIMRTIIKKTIKASGFSVSNFFDAPNGREALIILREESVDLVLTDYNMPEMDGLELIDEMKKSDTLNDIPVIMITTEGSNERVDEFMEKGAVDYIRKPFSVEEVRDKLNLIMGEAENGEGSLNNGDEGLDF